MRCALLIRLLCPIAIAMLAMAIMIHFWLLYWATGYLRIYTPTLKSNLPLYAAATLPGAMLDQSDGKSGSSWRILCALIAHKPAHGHGHMNMTRKLQNNEFLRELKESVVVFFFASCVCVCPVGVLCVHMDTIQPQTTNMQKRLPAGLISISISQLI